MNQLVIDIGNKYLSLSIIETKHEQYTLIETVIRDVENKNSNLLGRLIKREYEELSRAHTIDNTIIIPRRNRMLHQQITLEYQSTPKEMKELLLSNVHLPNDDGDFITDWTIQDDSPDEDYQKIFTSSVVVDEFKEISDMITLTGIKKYSIIPSAPSIPNIMPHDGKSYLVMQMGHRVTTFYIVRDGNCERYLVNREFNGENISNSITSRTSMSNEELYEYKNNLTYIELEDSGAHTELCKCLAGAVSTMCENYVSTEFQTIAGYAVIGGISNLDLDAAMRMSELNMPRIYPRLPAVNDGQIPGLVRPYLYETFSVLSEPEGGTNLTAPKDKSLGQNIKAIVSVFDKVKIFMNIAIIAILLTIGLNYIQNTMLEDKITSEGAILGSYQSEVSALEKSVKTLTTQYFELLDDKELAIVNYGDTLSELRDLVPQGSFITNIEDVTAELLREEVKANKKKSKSKKNSNKKEEKEGAMPEIRELPKQLLVALNIRGYTDQRHKAFDYALLLTDNGYNADIVEVTTTDEGVFKYEIEMVINK